MVHRCKVAMGSYDYANYFGRKEFYRTLVYFRLRPARVTSMHRVLKRGKALSPPFVAYNGYGQGNVLSFIHAFLMTSWQFEMLDAIHPWVQNVDDRNFTGSLADILEVASRIHEFDKLAMQQPLHDKTAFLLTDE